MTRGKHNGSMVRVVSRNGKTYYRHRDRQNITEEVALKRQASFKRYKERHPERVKASGRNYHLQQMEKLAGRPRPSNCECCGGPPNSRRSKRLEYDHDHATGEFRGWLCRNCNGALGMVKDNPQHLDKLKQYLKGAQG